MTTPPTPTSTLFPYTTLFRSDRRQSRGAREVGRLVHPQRRPAGAGQGQRARLPEGKPPARARDRSEDPRRSEEHTSELQSLTNLVCRLLLEKKKKQRTLLSHH